MATPMKVKSPRDTTTGAQVLEVNRMVQDLGHNILKVTLHWACFCLI